MSNQWNQPPHDGRNGGLAFVIGFGVLFATVDESTPTSTSTSVTTTRSF
ncbi:hypothetical protein KBP53_06465 [Corynebacterium genitalium ATCC 33030]|uniref:Uncharacterized protein n=1 Tax=Corynebacterium genitalium ATCC 33030 TaxID=585529 RepID=D7WCI5_9CORY|nr:MULTISPECIES: hypothetical protein [Corynebacterium]MCQ4618733.1 hypothetical protein [Corynebacterium pseudogenitalium]EFK53866.1 hypothetical protein HMPREF0291_11523 [Corynebacterium genitalium ATCC 33030]MCQ4620408.1 hypothetical protein [Corynebacterium sp. CCUG 71335]MCQ4622232.1 hypothetical protein [Corynebacterium sp. CCUG 70398]MCQ4627071.1 hypothetical protein [Corynebacterium sp. CCUG 65737]